MFFFLFWGKFSQIGEFIFQKRKQEKREIFAILGIFPIF
jgi:hypothetical protein